MQNNTPPISELKELAQELPTKIFGERLKNNPDQTDIVKLNHCSKLIAHFIACDSQVLYRDEAKVTVDINEYILSKLNPGKFKPNSKSFIELSKYGMVFN